MYTIHQFQILSNVNFLPDSGIFTDVCGSIDGIDCNIIDGKMTLISDETGLDTSEIDALICSILNGESWTSVHPAIQDITCIQESTSGSDGDGVSSSTPPFEPVSEQIGAYSYLVGVAAALVIVLGIYGYRRRHMKKDGVQEIGPLDDSDVVNMSNSISFENGGALAGPPAMDFTPINDPKLTYTAHGGIEAIARQSYFPVSQWIMLL